MADYDITEAFEEIENELIDSMMRNFKHHRVEETAEGYLWSQWQAEQFKALEAYRKRNNKKFTRRFSQLNGKVTEMLKTANSDGYANQEVKILEAVQNGFKGYDLKPSQTASAAFFRTNDKKLNALIKATVSDLKRAETAILRMSNDKYRKAIFNAQVFSDTGAGTYEKAVDMACRDMLRAGLNCVEYKNGARHTLSDYAEMALRTADKRAYLYGEGQKRQEWGIAAVIVNNRRGGCPHCAPYVGRVFIDDVYSGGNKSDGKYPLLSEAIRGGLFHPRCKDSTSTYFEGITQAKPVTKEELAEMDRREKLEQKQSYCKNEAKKNRRIAEHSLDPDNQRAYAHRADVFEQKADEISINLRTIDAMSKSFRPQYEPYSDFVLQTANREIKIPVKRVRNSEFELFTDVEATRRNKAVRLIEKQLQELKKQFPPDYTFPKVAIVDFQKHGFGSTAIAGYDNKMGIVYFNSLYHSPKSIVSFLKKNSGEFASTSQFAPLLHEFGHKYYYDCIQTLAKSNKLTYNKAKGIIDGKISEYIHDNITGSGLNLSMVLSSYADYSYQKGKLTEVIAEAFSSEDNLYGNKLIKVLKEEVSNASSAR